MGSRIKPPPRGRFFAADHVLRASLLACVATVIGLLSSATVLASPTAGNGPAARACDRAASPRGSDGAAGTVRRPFATLSRLAAALRPGQTGCLFAGRYPGNVVIRQAGTARRRITLRSFPSHASATIKGSIDWEPGGRYWRVTGLTIDGAGISQAAVQIHDDGIQLDHDDITNENDGQSCITDGNLQYGVTHGVVIDRNRIHDCGSSTNAALNHGVYVCCGYDTRVTNNYIWNTTGYGIQLYPDADGAVVDHNVVDGSQTKSGIELGGDTYTNCHVTDDATISNNILTDNHAYGVNIFWGCGRGGRNRATGNCLWGNHSGGVARDVGLSSSRNVVANPRFVAPQRHDFRLRRGSPCGRMAPRGRVRP